MFNRYFSIAAAGVVLGMLSATAATADALDDIKKKGVLVVGTKADYRPFGFLDPSGKIVGFEPDLAADVAKRLGVKLELVPVVASNRIQFLQQGKIDMMIATTSDTPDRRKIVDFIDPNYYGSGTNVLAPKSAALKNWEGLRGKKVCLIQGAFYNKELQEKYGVDGVAFPGTAEAYAALKNGNCVGLRVRRHGDRRRDAETRVERVRDAARLDPVRAVGHRGQAGREGPRRHDGEDHRRMAQVRVHPGPREEVGHQAHEVRPGNARQVQIATARAAGALEGRDASRPSAAPACRSDG